uniref:Uncharacterized protein n=1 Tax=Anguilla anguilla TaxID=7936 RepID=A0A0E9SPK7_ANGAN
MTGVKPKTSRGFVNACCIYFRIPFTVARERTAMKGASRGRPAVG